MARASKSAVKRLERSAQGSFTTRTPCVGHWLRGGLACRMGGHRRDQPFPRRAKRARGDSTSLLLQPHSGPRLTLESRPASTPPQVLTATQKPEFPISICMDDSPQSSVCLFVVNVLLALSKS